MKKSLEPGIEHEFIVSITDSKTVSALLPESEEFQVMPKVLATGYMVGLIEWACIQAINSYIDWPEEMTVGTNINVSHVAATPPGLSVQIKVRLSQVEGRKLTFDIVAKDDSDLISQGTHERYIINPDQFNQKVARKRVK
jgi:fluoroacetyl-CoA thioesterase